MTSPRSHGLEVFSKVLSGMHQRRSLLSPEMPFRQSQRNQREQERFHGLPLLVRVALLLAGVWQGERAVGAHPREVWAWGLRLRPCCSRYGRLPLALDHLLLSYIHG